MSAGTTPPTGPSAPGVAPARSDRSPWNWLLLVAVVVPLLVPFHNRVEPTLLGRPFFYWVQLAFVPLGVLATFLAYRAARRRPTADRTDRER
jgi:hypothetical protein